MSLVVLPTRIDDGGFIRPGACLVDKYEVTNSEYREFLNRSGYRPEEDAGFPFLKPGAPPAGEEAGLKEGSSGDTEGDTVFFGGARTAGAGGKAEPSGWGEFPVVFVNFGDAKAYADFSGKEIPTWSEWLAAAGVTPARPYPWGDRFVRFFCNSLRARIGGPTRVGTFESGKSPWGCYDMAGNVAEWTATVANPFPEQVGVSVHLVAGGSFNEWGYPRESKNIFDILRSPREEESRNRNSSVGFRCVRRNAVPLVAGLVDRLETLPAGSRAEAIRELAKAGTGMRDVLFLLDFKRRSTLVREMAGLFTIENLGDVRNGRGDEFLLKPLEGDMTALSGKRVVNWSVSLDSFCKVTLVRDGRGTVRKVAVFENGPERLVVRDPQDGKSLWTASARGAPHSVAGVFTADGGSLFTSWVDEETVPSPTSLLLCHRFDRGRLLWEKHFDGVLTSFELRAGGILAVVENRGGYCTEFFLIAADSGRELARAAVEGVRSLRFLPASGRAPFLLAVDGTAALPEMETAGLFPTTVPAMLASLYHRFTGGSLAALLDHLAGRLVVTVDTGEGGILEVDTRLGHYLAGDWKAGGIDRKIVFDPGGGLTGEEAVSLCDEYLDQRILIEAVVGDGSRSSAAIVTEIDRRNRVALFSSLPGGRCGTMILLRQVQGFSFEIFAVKNGKTGGKSGLLLWSSGGTMIHFDAAGGRLHWWRELPGFSGRKPLVAELDGDGSSEVLVFSPSGEIIIIDLATGDIELRLKKTGAVITDLNVVDTDGDGLSEILAGFKDEGVYLVNPRLAGRGTGLDLALSGMEELFGGPQERVR